MSVFKTFSNVHFEYFPPALSLFFVAAVAMIAMAIITVHHTMVVVFVHLSCRDTVLLTHVFAHLSANISHLQVWCSHMPGCAMDY